MRVSFPRPAPALSLALPLALALGACTGSYGEDTPASAATAMASSPREYVAMAGASDLYEIESSRLALERVEDERVRDFARMMITQHTATTQQITAAARSAGFVPDQPQLMPMQRAMMDELSRLSGDAFERTYLAQQRRAHDMALALHSNYAQNGQSPELQQVAAAAVPIIEDHIRRLRMMP